MDVAADRDAAGQGAAFGDPALEVLEASLSDRHVFLLRARCAGGGAPEQLEIRLDGAVVGTAGGRADGEGGVSYAFQAKLGAAPALACRMTLVPLGTDGVRPVQVPLRGRLGPAAPVWFADATWTAEPDVIAALRDERPAVLVFCDALPHQGARRWAPVANLAAALRQAGHRAILLHYGDTAECADDADPVLRHFDVLHHHQLPVPLQPWKPDTPGSLPVVDRTLVQALDGIAAASRASMLIAASDTAFGILGRLTVKTPRAALLPRDMVLAPRMIFGPNPREKAVTTLRTMLQGCALLVDDEGLLVEALKWMPGAHAVVLPLGPPLTAAAVSRNPGVDAVVATGPIAAAALRQAMPEAKRIDDLGEDAPLDRILTSLAQARLLVGWTDGGVAAALSWRIAAAWGIPCVGRPPVPLPAGPSPEADIAALGAMLHAWQDAPMAAPPARPDWDAGAFAAELGLPPGHGTATAAPLGFLRRLLELRLDGQADRAGIGLLLGADDAQGVALAAAFAAIQGPDRVFARGPQPGAAGVRPLREAPALGVHSVLMDTGEDRSAGMARMERVVEAGLAPLPLIPQATWTDREGFARLRSVRAGRTAYVGAGPVPEEAELVLVTGGATLDRADVVELRSPDDPRRGALLTIFAANGDTFWRRPPAPALGYDRDAASPGLRIERGLACPHPAVPMLAVALHLGCARVMVDEAWQRDPSLATSFNAMEEAGIIIEAAPSALAELSR